MKLPYAQLALVPKPKIVDYLLDEEHPDGKHKAVFFKRFGFSVEEWQVFRDALLEHALTQQVAREVVGPYGTKYLVEGPLQTPDHRNPLVRSVWMLTKWPTVPRFVTAYPL